MILDIDIDIQDSEVVSLGKTSETRYNYLIRTNLMIILKMNVREGVTQVGNREGKRVV